MSSRRSSRETGSVTRTLAVSFIGSLRTPLAEPTIPIHLSVPSLTLTSLLFPGLTTRSPTSTFGREARALGSPFGIPAKQNAFKQSMTRHNRRPTGLAQLAFEFLRQGFRRLAARDEGERRRVSPGHERRRGAVRTKEILEERQQGVFLQRGGFE